MTKESLGIFDRKNVPFALAFCEKPAVFTVTGNYDESRETWVGLTAAANLTLTLTVGYDRDMD